MIGPQVILYLSVGIAIMSLLVTIPPVLGSRRLRPGSEGTSIAVPTSREARGAYVFRYQNRLAVYWLPLLAISCALVLPSINRAFPSEGHQAASHLKRAEQASNSGNLPIAVNEYTIVLAYDPESVDAHLGRGIALRKLGRFRESVRDLSASIKLENHNPTAYLNRGLAYSAMGKPRLAIHDFTTAIRQDDGMAQAYLNRGYTNKQIGRLVAALRDFNHAIRLMPKVAAPYLGRGLVYVSMGEMTRAKADLGKAVRLSSDPSEIFLARRQLAEIDQVSGRRSGSNKKIWTHIDHEPALGDQ